MRNLKRIALAGIIVIIAVATSCKKDSALPDLTKNITGTYEGTLTDKSDNTMDSAMAEVSKVNDYTVMIHCYGNDFDTTFNLELYEDGSMMRVCFTDDEFYKEYGHNKSENHHMMNNKWMDWNEHMSADHDSNDKHYGYFNTDERLFNYSFEMMKDKATFVKEFSGKK